MSAGTPADDRDAVPAGAGGIIGIVNAFLRHRIAANLLALGVVLLGVLALGRLNTQFFPTVHMRCAAPGTPGIGAAHGANWFSPGLCRPETAHAPYPSAAAEAHPAAPPHQPIHLPATCQTDYAQVPDAQTGNQRGSVAQKTP